MIIYIILMTIGYIHSAKLQMKLKKETKKELLEKIPKYEIKFYNKQDTEQCGKGNQQAARSIFSVFNY